MVASPVFVPHRACVRVRRLGENRPMARSHDFRVWPIATNFSLGPDVSFWGEAEVGRAAEFAASVENDPEPT